MENNENKGQALDDQELESAVGGVSKEFSKRYLCKDCGAVTFSAPANKKCPKCGGDVVLQERR